MVFLSKGSDEGDCSLPLSWDSSICWHAGVLVLVFGLTWISASAPCFGGSRKEYAKHVYGLDNRTSFILKVFRTLFKRLLFFFVLPSIVQVREHSWHTCVTITRQLQLQNTVQTSSQSALSPDVSVSRVLTFEDIEYQARSGNSCVSVRRLASQVDHHILGWAGVMIGATTKFIFLNSAAGMRGEREKGGCWWRTLRVLCVWEEKRREEERKLGRVL